MNHFHHALLLICGLVLCGGLSAQALSPVTDSNTEYDKRTMPSLSVSIEAPVDRVYDLWQDFWEDRYDIDIDRSDKDGSNISYLAEQVNMPLVSDKNFDLYSNVDGTDKVSTVSLTMAFAERDIVTRSNHPEAYREASSILTQFRTFFYTEYFEVELSEVREELEDAREEAADASKDAEKARKKIQKYEDKIEKLREQIEDTREDVGDEIEAAERSESRVRELEERLRSLERARSSYLG